jgi:hypothetical protein
MCPIEGSDRCSENLYQSKVTHPWPWAKGAQDSKNDTGSIFSFKVPETPPPPSSKRPKADMSGPKW